MLTDMQKQRPCFWTFATTCPTPELGFTLVIFHCTFFSVINKQFELGGCVCALSPLHFQPNTIYKIVKKKKKKEAEMVIKQHKHI